MAENTHDGGVAQLNKSMELTSDAREVGLLPKPDRLDCSERARRLVLAAVDDTHPSLANDAMYQIRPDSNGKVARQVGSGGHPAVILSLSSAKAMSAVRPYCGAPRRWRILDPMPLDSQTDTAENTSDSPNVPAKAAHLVVAFQAEQPFAPPRRYPILSVDVVRIGRKQDALPNELSIELSDAFVSSPHALLRRVLDRWVIEDAGSTNGTFVDGAMIDRCELHDGSVIEIGHTFMVFRVRAAEQALAAGVDEYATMHPGLEQRLRELQRVARSDLPVMLRGESGTGKEVLAQAVHRLSGRTGPFQAVNCAALVPTLAESELFGYRKGAFSGALEDRPGLIRAAANGTLFLDEIGDLSLAVQAALLRVLQQSEVLPVGATRAVSVDFRLVVATHRDLERMAMSGAFRSDLLARISGFTMPIPPLRERREDLGLIAAALLRRHVPDRADSVRFSLRAARALFFGEWPLNVRELEKALAVSLTLVENGRIDADHFHSSSRAEGSTESPVDVKTFSTAEEKQREDLVKALRINGGNVTAAARSMGKARQQVQRWMRRYGFKSSQFRR
jgi:DNA-binding NtrC family response regulator